MPPERTVWRDNLRSQAKPKMTRQEFCDLNGVSSELLILGYAGSSKGREDGVAIDMAAHLVIFQNTIYTVLTHGVRVGLAEKTSTKNHGHGHRHLCEYMSK